MKTKKHFMYIFTAILFVISFLWLFFDLYAFQQIRAKAPQTELLSKGIVIGYIPAMLLYIFYFIFIISHLKQLAKFRFLTIPGILLAVASFITMFTDFAALSDIGGEYLIDGYACTMEWASLYIGFVIHCLFYVTGFALLYKLMRNMNSFVVEKVTAIREIVFEIIQYVGMVCGFGGIAFIILAYITLGDKMLSASHWIIGIISGYCMVIIISYIAVILFWFIKLNRKKILSEWDEKQNQDLASAGLYTWLISIPVMLVLYFIHLNKTGLIFTILWFPFFIFSTLFIFSLLSLYKFKKG